MHLVQLLLPLYNNAGRRLAKTLYTQVRDELVERFGGMTGYTRAPVSGLWQASEGRTVRDELIVYEVMVETIDEQWWRQYRGTLENRFQQESLVVRAYQILIL